MLVSLKGTSPYFLLEISILSLNVLKLSSSLKKINSFTFCCPLSKCNDSVNHNKYNHKMCLFFKKRNNTNCTWDRSFWFFFFLGEGKVDSAGSQSFKYTTSGGKTITQKHRGLPGVNPGNRCPYRVCENAEESGMWLECSCGGCTPGSWWSPGLWTGGSSGPAHPGTPGRKCETVGAQPTGRLLSGSSEVELHPSPPETLASARSCIHFRGTSLK